MLHRKNLKYMNRQGDLRRVIRIANFKDATTAPSQRPTLLTLDYIQADGVFVFSRNAMPETRIARNGASDEDFADTAVAYFKDAVAAVLVMRGRSSSAEHAERATAGMAHAAKEAAMRVLTDIQRR